MFSSRFRVAETVVKVGIPFIVTFGILGNLLSAATMLRKRFRSTSSSVYLLLLAISDTLYLLLNGMTRRWVSDYVVKLYMSDMACQMNMASAIVVSCTSSWLLVAVMLERVIVTSLPHKAKWLATRWRAWWLSFAIISGGIVIGAIFYPHVKSVLYFHRFYACIHPYLALDAIYVLFYSSLPSFVLFCFNIILIKTLRRSKLFQKEQIMIGAKGNGLPVIRMTTTLLTISSLFVILTLPKTIYFLLAHIVGGYGTYEFFVATYLPSIMNHAINGYFYCMTGTSFRREAWALLRCK